MTVSKFENFVPMLSDHFRGSDLHKAICQFVVVVLVVGMIRNEFIYELLHYRQVSGIPPPPIHFLKAHDVSFVN